MHELPSKPAQAQFEQPPDPEQRKLLDEYIELKKKFNGAGSDMLSLQQLKRLGELRNRLGDDVIQKHVTRWEVNGPIL